MVFTCKHEHYPIEGNTTLYLWFPCPGSFVIFLILAPNEGMWIISFLLERRTLLLSNHWRSLSIAGTYLYLFVIVVCELFLCFVICRLLTCHWLMIPLLLFPLPLLQGIVGNLASGKSALVHRYLTGTYVQEESPEGKKDTLYFSVFMSSGWICLFSLFNHSSVLKKHTKKPQKFNDIQCFCAKFIQIYPPPSCLLF